ncbi:MAG: glycerophosphodiester phosphodiesterase [Micromonosporaceae bacterium]
MTRLRTAVGAAVIGAAAVAALGVPTQALAATGPEAATAATAATPATRPIVIGHRGASGYRPEHTLASYRLAIKQGADYIEPDLVSTKDGQLVARHENEISGTTDVADHPEFAGRKTSKTIDGRTVTGWFTEDFTLAELKTLRAKERLPELRPANTRFDGAFQVPTLQEVIDLARKESRRTGRTIGIYPETKHPTYFASIGLALEPKLVATLRANDLDGADDAVIIQSFETANLRALDAVIDVPLAQLLHTSGKPYDFVVTGDPRTYRDLATPEGLAWIAGYADGIGVNKNLIVPRDSAGRLLEPTSLIDDAHTEGLIVHAWTFRNENTFLPADFRIGDDPAAWGDFAAEYALFYSLGVDGVFADQPDGAVAARDSAAEAA